jgi:cell division protein FtsZ
VKPSTPTETPSNQAPQTDLFSNKAAAATQQVNANAVEKNDSQMIRHTLELEDNSDVEEIEEDPNPHGFELKTSPSMFEFKLPTVFDTYKSEEPVEEPAPAPAPEPVMEAQPQKAEIELEEAKKEETNFEDQLLKTKERILRLKELSMKLKSSNGLQELENEPAYKRKQKTLDDVPHSSESQVSRFTLSFDDGETEIRPNNSFLHDNVD